MLFQSKGGVMQLVFPLLRENDGSVCKMYLTLSIFEPKSYRLFMSSLLRIAPSSFPVNFTSVLFFMKSAGTSIKMQSAACPVSYRFCNPPRPFRLNVATLGKTYEIFRITLVSSRSSSLLFLILSQIDSEYKDHPNKLLTEKMINIKKDKQPLLLLLLFSFVTSL